MNELADLIVEEIRMHPGTSWRPVRSAVRGCRDDRIDAVRDELLEAGVIVNVVDGVALSSCPPRRRACLHLGEAVALPERSEGQATDGPQLQEGSSPACVICDGVEFFSSGVCRGCGFHPAATRFLAEVEA